MKCLNHSEENHNEYESHPGGFLSFTFVEHDQPAGNWGRL